MTARHDGRVAIVTGGTRGIGRAITHRLVAEGAHVVATARAEAGLDALAAELGDGVTTVRCHAADEAGAAACVEQVMAAHGRIDLLVNNAAVSAQWGPTIAVTEALATKMTSVNLWAPLMWTQLVQAAGMRARGGAIVNISSLGGLVVAPHTGYYNATKSALRHLTSTLSAELAPTIRVNTIAPGLIDTDMAKAIPQDQRDELTAQIPLGRLGTPEDIADAAAFLLSDEAAWITGATLVVDGGTRHRAARLDES